MKRVFLGATATVCLMIALSTVSTAQTSTASLGDYARSVRQNKPQEKKTPAKVYDNDTIPSATTISIVGAAPQIRADAAKDNSNQADAKAPDAKPNDKAAASDTKTADKKAPSETKPGQSLEDREKVFDVWKKRIADQKKKIDQLTHDLNDFQHNSAVAQVSLWPDTQRYGQGLADKQKALDQAKTELSDLQEQARKAGVPASLAE